MEKRRRKARGSEQNQNRKGDMKMGKKKKNRPISRLLKQAKERKKDYPLGI